MASSRKKHKIRHGDSPGSERQANDRSNTTIATQAQKFAAFSIRDEALRSLATCKICFRMLYEPYTLGCGHTYCYSCLCQWFQNANRNKKTCPDCRTVITRQPAPAYALREIVRELLSRPQLLPETETVSEHEQNRMEEAAIVEQDKANTDPSTRGLFKGAFLKAEIPAGLTPIHDVQDGVMRCPRCTWELEGHDILGCPNCALEFFNSEDDQSFTGTLSEDEGSLSGSEDDDTEVDGDLDMNDAEFDETLSGTLAHYQHDSDAGSESGFSPPQRERSSPSYYTAGSDVNGDEHTTALHGGGLRGTYTSDEDDEEEDEDDSLDGFVVGDDDLHERDEEGADSDSSGTSTSTTVPPPRANYGRQEHFRPASHQLQQHQQLQQGLLQYAGRPKPRRIVEESSDEDETSETSASSDRQATSEEEFSVSPDDGGGLAADVLAQAARAGHGGRSGLAWRSHEANVNDGGDELSDESASAEDDEEDGTGDSESSDDEQSTSEEDEDVSSASDIYDNSDAQDETDENY